MTTLMAIVMIFVVSAVVFLLGICFMWVESKLTKPPQHHSKIYGHHIPDYWNRKKG